MISKLKNKGQPLREVAIVRFAVKTGANDFFYLKRMKEKSEVSDIIKVKNKAGFKGKIESKYLKPLVKGPGEIKGYEIAEDHYTKNYIFSCHTLEHLENPVKAINIWKTKLSDNGLIFLYLPHPDMEYWLPQNNKKHLHSWYPKQMIKIFKDLNFKNIIFSERDLYWSYSVIGWT